MTRQRRTAPHGTWAARRAFLALRQRFREGRDALSETSWTAWRRNVAAGGVVLFAAMLVLRIGAERALGRGWLAWEGAFLSWLSTVPYGLSDAVFFQTFGSDITLVILVCAAAAGAVWVGRPLSAVSLLLAFAGTDLVVRFGWLIWDRARPDILYEGVAAPGFHSFPSGHAAKTAAVYGLLAFMWGRASGSAAERLLAVVLAALIAAVTGAARVAMGAHWPSDVAAGLLLGAGWAAVLAWALRHETRRDQGV